MRPLLTAVVLSTLLLSSHATCPDKDTTLQSWSAASTWPNSQLPQQGQNVSISKPILLDTTPPELFSITLEAGGKLVWSSGGDYSLRLHYLLVKTDGEMHIGSEACRFDKKATITLLGEPGELNIAGFGEKFVGVQQGGTLELHGRDKLSWTKIVTTIPKFDKANGQLFGHQDMKGTTRGHGIYAYQFTPDGAYVNRLFRYVQSDKQSSVDWNIGKLQEFIDAIPDGDIFAFATQRSYNKAGKDHSKLYDVIDDVAGTNQFRNVQANGVYVLITVKGQTSTTVDDLANVDPKSSIHTASVRVERRMTVSDKKLQLVVESVHDAAKDWNGFANFRVLDTAYSNPILDLAEEPKGWGEGDKIFVTSTDYNWRQVEERTIISCDSCSANQIRLDAPFEYVHFGEIVQNVDMRAEVGLMTRNILIQGEVSKDQTNGGHVKFLKGFKSVRLEGVELTKMGQPLVIGRYPLHYHMCEDLADPNIYPIRPYIKRNSIHHTHFRCVTIHGTHSAQLIENVCYDTVGHGFFLEDGGEKNTYYYRNLGLGQRRWRGKVKVPVTGTIPTDSQATTFWLTNPKTTLIGNVAAGGDGAGMWFVYPDIPTGPSRDKNFMAEREARHTKITLFDNNVAHSYHRSGLFVDNIEQDDLTVKGYNQYSPKQDPLDTKSPDVPAIFNRLTAYKNRIQNAWIRGSWMIVANSSFSDSRVGITMLRENSLTRHVINSVIIGESSNLGEPEKVKLQDGTRITLPRSIPFYWDPTEPIRGYRLLHGPENLENVFFDGFKDNQYYPAAAIWFRLCRHTDSFRSVANNVKFGFDDSSSSGNRFMDGKAVETCQDDDNEFFRNSFGFIEKDGSKSQIVQSNPFMMTGRCQLRQNWKLASCPHNYARMEALLADDMEMTVMRTDAPFPTYSTDRRFPVITGGSHTYLGVLEGDVPKELSFRGIGVTPSKSVRMAVCVPRDAEISAFYYIGSRWSAATRVCSLQAVDTDTKGGKYHYDEKTGVMFFKVMGNSEYQPGEMNDCPNKNCPMFNIRINDGDLKDSDCVARFKSVAEYVEPSTGAPVDDTSVLPSDGANPPPGWGAGSTYP